MSRRYLNQARPPALYCRFLLPKYMYVIDSSFCPEKRTLSLALFTSQIYNNLVRRAAMKPSNSDVSRYYDEMLRLLNEILAELKENNAMLKEHNSVVVVSSIDDNDRVRKIGVNTGNLR
jgi:hypothetical protein